MKYKAIKHANVNEALTNAEVILRNLVGKANRSRRTGKPMALTATGCFDPGRPRLEFYSCCQANAWDAHHRA